MIKSDNLKKLIFKNSRHKKKNEQGLIFPRNNSSGFLGNTVLSVSKERNKNSIPWALAAQKIKDATTMKRSIPDRLNYDKKI